MAAFAVIAFIIDDKLAFPLRGRWICRKAKTNEVFHD